MREAVINKDDFTKAERRVMRELVPEIHEVEARKALAALDAGFQRWRERALDSGDLIAAIHEFHQRGARDLWSTYSLLKDPELLARGVGLGFIAEDRVPDAIREKLASLIEFYRPDA